MMWKLRLKEKHYVVIVANLIVTLQELVFLMRIFAIRDVIVKIVLMRVHIATRKENLTKII